MRTHAKTRILISITFLLTLLFVINYGFSKSKKIIGEKGYGSTKKPLIPHNFNSKVANVWTRLTNYGFIGDDSFNEPSFEWPGGSGNHYLYQGSIWVAGKDASGVVHCAAGDETEFTWTHDEEDVVRLWDLDDLYFQNRPNVDPSFSGLQVSDEDTYAQYTDLDNSRHNNGEAPLGVRIIERTYKWTAPYNDDFIIFDFQIINIGLDSDQDGEADSPQKLTEVYVAIRFDADVSYGASGAYWYDDLVDYDSQNQISYMYDGDDPDRPGDDQGEAGISPGYIYARMLKATGGTPVISYTNPISHTWWTIDDDPGTDSLKFVYMSTPGYAAIPDSTYDYRFLQTVGPFTMEPNDIINVVWACGIGAGLDTIILNSDFAKQIFDNGYIVPSTGGIINSDNERLPQRFNLYHAYPNPFNPKTVISWQLAVGSDVELSVYNLLGQKVKTLVSERQPAGYHEVEFDGQNLSSGIYFYRIEARDPAKRTGTWQDVKKMILLR